MRIKHKYLRNKHVRSKYWNRVRSREHPFETHCPYVIHIASRNYWVRGWDFDEQVKDHFRKITEQVRGMDKGHHGIYYRNASSSFRRMINKQNKANIRNAISRIRNGDYDYEVPNFKRDAAWLYW
jgi:hypothetical protein